MPLIHINDRSRDRYSALSISSVWELTKIRPARALVVGAGALGNEVSKNLAMMGVQLIVVLDRDTVETANLTRSVFFREGDHGRPKVDVIAERLVELNPDVNVLPLNGDLDAILGLGLLRRMDMVFSCLDSRLARRSVNRMCQKVEMAWVDGAMENFLGYVAAYVPDKGPCYECTLTRGEKALIANVASCRQIALKNLSYGKVPTTSTMGSIVAAIQVQEAVKLLHGQIEGSLAGKRLAIDCTCNDFYVTESDRNDNCEGHFRFGGVIEVPDFYSSRTSARTLLERFTKDTGQEGSVDLGREIVLAMRCVNCDTVESLGEPLQVVSEDRAKCKKCGKVQRLETTHIVSGDESYADRPLSQLGIPKLDILEVKGNDAVLAYEMSGDLAEFPACLQGEYQEALPASSGALA